MRSSLCEKQNNFFIRRNIIFFLEPKYILFSETHFFKIAKNLITRRMFLPRHILKNIDIPQQKRQMLHW